MEPGTPAQTKEIIDKVNKGELKVEDLDICVKRILEYLLKTPKYRNYQYSNKPDLKAHAAVTRQSANEGMVLLKNSSNTLPIKDMKRISVFGITSYDFIAGGTGSGDVNKAYTIDLMTGLNGAGLEVNEKLAKVYQSYKDYQNNLSAAVTRRGWFWGKPVLPELDLSRDVINSQAEESEMAIITIGRQAGEGSDRKEAVQLYVSAPSGGLVKPAKELKSFAKTRELKPRESQTLTMKVSAYDLASYNEATQAWETAQGRYTIHFGASVEDIRTTATYTQSKAAKVQCHDVLKPSMELSRK